MIKSKSPNYPKHIFFGVIAIWGFYAGAVNDSTVAYLFAGIFGGFTLLEILLYSRVTLQLNENELQVKRMTIFGTELDNYTIPQKEIRATHYEVEKYDTYALYRYFILEMLFPSGQSTFTILKMDGKKHEFLLKANENEVRTFMEKLPDRVPNG